MNSSCIRVYVSACSISIWCMNCQNYDVWISLCSFKATQGLLWTHCAFLFPWCDKHDHLHVDNQCPSGQRRIIWISHFLLQSAHTFSLRKFTDKIWLKDHLRQLADVSHNIYMNSITFGTDKHRSLNTTDFWMTIRYFVTQVLY